MKYNEKHDRYLDEDYNVYYYDRNKDKLMPCKLNVNYGYYRVAVKNRKFVYLHRIIYETFVGEIPDGMVLDHKDTHRYNNSLDNLILCTQKENCNNPKTRKHNSLSKIGNKCALGKPTSEFGKLFKEKYGITRIDNVKLYDREKQYFYRNGRLK